MKVFKSNKQKHLISIIVLWKSNFLTKKKKKKESKIIFILVSILGR